MKWLLVSYYDVQKYVDQNRVTDGLSPIWTVQATGCNFSRQLKEWELKCDEWSCSWLPKTYTSHTCTFGCMNGLLLWLVHWCCLQSQRMSLVACHSPVASHVFWPTFLPTWSTKRSLQFYRFRSVKAGPANSYFERQLFLKPGKRIYRRLYCSFRCTPTHLAHCSSSWVL